MTMNHAQKFQKTVGYAIKDAAKENVHPAVVHTILCMYADDVKALIRNMKPEQNGEQPPANDPNPATASPAK